MALEEAAAGVVILGAGQAGGRAAEALRGKGFAGAVTIVGDEVHPPHERPSLSKDMLLDLAAEKLVWVRPPDWYAANDIALRLGVAARGIDREQCRVLLDDGSTLQYGALILATGARPRALPVPGADHLRCRMLRTIEDSRALRVALADAARLVVIGAGFIGLEVASAARRQGCTVTVLEIGALPLARCVPPEIGAFYAELHARHGVDLRLGSAAVAIHDRAGRAVVETSTGDALEADLVVIGIGIVPNDELAAASGIAVNHGITTDEFGMTTDHAVFAAGDVSRHYNPLLGRHVLLESWQNAQNQAIAVARNIVGPPTPYAEIPWFWSDQYGINLQITGLPVANGRVVMRGTPGDGPALALQISEDRLVCAVALDAPRELRAAKEIIARRGAVPEATLQDCSISLAEIYRGMRRPSSIAS
jgi:NADPH-dependent 2,4-dienoyl-CoA reductase/sulfur reductase-like enzyme